MQSALFLLTDLIGSLGLPGIHVSSAKIPFEEQRFVLLVDTITIQAAFVTFSNRQSLMNRFSLLVAAG
jgi:hypothetical protein